MQHQNHTTPDPEITERLARVRWSLLSLKSDLCAQRFIACLLRVKTWEDQPRAPAGSSEGGEWTQIAGPLFRFDDGPTGILAVDQTTDALVEILAEVYARTGDGSGPLYGIEAHAIFGKLVADRGLPGISRKDIEQSFSLGEAATYGMAGSVRTDVLLRDSNQNIIGIYDLKTGSAKLTSSRVDELRYHADVSTDVPVIELRLQKGRKR